MKHKWWPKDAIAKSAIVFFYSTFSFSYIFVRLNLSYLLVLLFEGGI